jgi:hypothetical protein
MNNKITDKVHSHIILLCILFIFFILIQSMEFNELYELNDIHNVLNDINEIYEELECEYQSYIKTRQIVQYKPIDYSLITYLNCIYYISQFNNYKIKYF